MSQIILGAIALLGVLWLMKGFTKGNPTVMTRWLRKAGGLAVIGVGGLLLVRGRIDAGIPLIVLGLGIGGWTPSLAGIPGFSNARTTKTPGQVSRARTAMIEIELEIDTGVMRGTVLAGRYAGKALDSLSIEDFKAFYLETGADPDGRSILEAYLDRRFPTWREDFQQDTAAGTGKRARPSTAMTKEEAYQILGVQPGASVEDIRAAHRSLMKKLHPDQGGSTYLAARVNEAKDILLGSHG